MKNDSGELVDLYIPRKWYVDFISRGESFAAYNSAPVTQELFNLLIRSKNFSSATNRIVEAKDKVKSLIEKI